MRPAPRARATSKLQKQRKLQGRIRSHAAIITLVFVSVACSNNNGKAASGPGTSTKVRDATLVVGASQEPDCLDPFASCGTSVWGYWIANALTLPRAFDVVDNVYRPGSILSGEPKVTAGPPVTVTYRIRPEARWSDGTPITAADFKATWHEVMTGSDVVSRAGYEAIANVNDKDPGVAIVTFARPFAGWRDLFSAYGGLLPKHILEKGPRSATMANGYKFSGGPYQIESWRKGEDLTLVPNPRWWGPKPKITKVVFRFLPDTPSEIKAFSTKQVRMIFPPPDAGLASVARATGTSVAQGSGNQFEALIFNTTKPPLDDRGVRQAVAYAIDRESIVANLVAPMQPTATRRTATPMQSLTLRPSGAKSSDVGPFARYTHDLKAVGRLMTTAGWTMRDGFWHKGDQRATLTISTTAGEPTRAKVEELLRSQLREAGFELTVENAPPQVVGGEWGPTGRFSIILIGQVSSPDPSRCELVCSEYIPSPTNDEGGNWARLQSPAVDAIWHSVDTELDAHRRAALVGRGEEALADAVAVLPLYQRPSTLLWNSVVKGPVAVNATLGPFWNLHEWSIAN